jgi:tRNA threonylcarbamoyladenosine biosynthesis protein TsaE
MMSNTNIFTTNSSKQTQKLGEILAKDLKGGEIICLSGELGSGKTTFAQGALNGLGAKKPYTSPTFVVMKQYKLKVQNLKRKTKTQNSKLEKVYHMDAYRVSAEDVLDLGWEEIIASKNNIVIIEWAERIKSIIPKDAVWIKFEHKDNNQRKLLLSSKLKIENSKSQLKV